MTLEVGLVHGVQSEMVEHGVHFGCIGIVACPDGVDVVLFHQHDVCQHHVCGDCASCHRICVGAVYALEEYLAVVDVDEFSFLLDVAEAVFCGKGFEFTAGSVGQFHHHCVERGGFGRP